MGLLNFCKSFVPFLLLGIGLLSVSACGLFEGSGPDEPFKFPDSDEIAGGACTIDDDCSGGKKCQEGQCVTVNLCDGITCENGQECNPNTGQCEAPDPDLDDSSECTNDQECEANEVCQAGVCVPDGGGNGGCSSNADCTGGTICNTATHLCVTPTCTLDPTICSDTQKCENGTCVCDPAKTDCSGITECETEFKANITLTIDDAVSPSGGHYDAPAACCEYSGVDGGSTCGTGQPVLDAGAFLGDHPDSASENTDQYCCATDDGEQVPGHPELTCGTENRHNGAPEIADVSWSPQQNKKIKVKFVISGDQCEAQINMADFPEWHLEATVFDASILIDAGKNYQTAPGGLPEVSSLNPPLVSVPCQITEDQSGNVSVAISDIPLRFMVALYVNYIQCLEVFDSSDCPLPFTELYNGDTERSFQIIPGFNNPPLSLGTLTRSIEPVNPQKQIGPMVITGEPLHFNTEKNSTRMRWVVAFSLPSSFANPVSPVGRDDHLGTGQLLAQLADAILTADLHGPVTRVLDGAPIRTLEDLTTGCQPGNDVSCDLDDDCADCQICQAGFCVNSGGGDCNDGGQSLTLTMQTTFAGENQNLSVAHEGALDQPFAALACILGIPNADGGCTFVEVAELPYAKEEGDPIAPELAAHFIEGGTLRIDNGAASTQSVILQVPESVGVFNITNANALQNITLAPGQSTTLNVEFNPTVDGTGCSIPVGSNLVQCNANLSLASSHNISIALKGQARLPAGELKLEEVAVPAPNGPLLELLPDLNMLEFGETLLGIQTKTKLLRLKNTGVRNLVVNNLTSQDAAKNFRIGSLYQGSNFAPGTRIWKVGGEPWTIPPTGAEDLFVFMNYGPFGSIAGADSSTRNDASSLIFAIDNGDAVDTLATLFLTGTAKEDKRATLALYISDTNRFNVSGVADKEGPNGEHLYLPTEQFFSFRQDATERDIYIYNNGVSGVHNLVIRSFTLNDPVAKFTPFPLEDGLADTMVGCAADNTTCPTLAGQEFLKIGTLTYAAQSGGNHTIHAANFTIDAVSQDGASELPPIIGGNQSTGNNNTVVAYEFKGASGAPSGPKDLKIHRLIAGFEGKLSSLQPTLIASSQTKGIVTRFNHPNFDPDEYKDIFTLDEGIDLNPVNGTAKLKTIVTPVDLNPNTPTPTADLGGLRLFNQLGSNSNPDAREHFVQCSAFPGSSCAFFYIYIGEWSGSTNSMNCGGQPDRLPVVPGYPSGGNARDALFNRVLKPDNPPDFACLASADGLAEKTGGIYDPVTGEIRFDDLAVRLYAPDVPKLGEDVDSTIRLSLTTGCVSVNDNLVPDPAAHLNYTVPAATLNDNSFDATLMSANPSVPNPLVPYVDQAGDNCAERELFGRPMFTEDTTETLDNGSDPDNLNYGGFDLAGVGRVTSNNGSVFSNNLYIVIKAEVGYQCANGEWVASGCDCSPPEVPIAGCE